jgi:tetratricopeptide (TPR) repeat protein
MNKILQIVIATFLVSSLAYSQDRNSAEYNLQHLSKGCYESIISNDSLKSKELCELLRTQFTHAKDQTISRLNAANSLGTYIALSNGTESALKLLSTELQSFKVSGLEADAARIQTLNLLGTMYISRKEWKNAGDSLALAITLADKIGDYTGVLENLTSLANLKALMGDKTRSLDYARKTVEYANSLSSKDIENFNQLMYSANRMLSMAYVLNNMSESALDAALIANQYADKAFSSNPNSAPILAINSDIASLMIGIGKFEEAIPFAIKASSSLDDPNTPVSGDSSSAMISLLTIYTNLDQVEKAKNIADSYTLRIENMPDNKDKIRALGSLGTFYMKNTNERSIARSLLVKAALLSYKLFGDTPTTNQLAELSESQELDQK